MTDKPDPVAVAVSEAEELLEFATVVAYGCCAWLVLSGVLSLYWASGGTVGVWTLWGGSDHLSGAPEPWLRSLVRALGAVEFALATLSVVVARRWRRGGLPTAVNATAFLVGLTLVPAVAVDVVAGRLTSLGWLDESAVDRLGVAWRLLFWNPWWVIGVLSYCGSAWLSQYATAERDRRTQPSSGSNYSIVIGSISCRSEDRLNRHRIPGGTGDLWPIRLRTRMLRWISMGHRYYVYGNFFDSATQVSIWADP